MDRQCQLSGPAGCCICHCAVDHSWVLCLFQLQARDKTRAVPTWAGAHGPYSLCSPLFSGSSLGRDRTGGSTKRTITATPLPPRSSSSRSPAKPALVGSRSPGRGRGHSPRGAAHAGPHPGSGSLQGSGAGVAGAGVAGAGSPPAACGPCCCRTDGRYGRAPATLPGTPAVPAASGGRAAPAWSRP